MRIVLAFTPEREMAAVAASLALAGHDVASLPDLGDGAAVGAIDPLAVVVLDMRTEPSSGVTLLRLIRSLRDDVGLLVLTRPHASNDVVGAMLAGADAHLDRHLDARLVEATVASIRRRIAGRGLLEAP